jgi:SAM-dependent methyltransferase
MRHSADGETRVRQSADRMYAAGQEIWPSGDPWHQHTRREIELFIHQHGRELLASSNSILDAGCGRDSYSWMPDRTTNLDRFYDQVRQKKRAVAGDLEYLPFKSSSFDLVLCIGSVINYVSALEAINELARVSKPGAHLILQFECSSSFEQFGKSSWNAVAHLNRTVNSGRSDDIWIYSPSYIFRALEGAGFRVLRKARFHVVSALLTRLGMDHNRATSAAKYDRFFSWLNLFADNLILLAERV